MDFGLVCSKMSLDALSLVKKKYEVIPAKKRC